MAATEQITYGAPDDTRPGEQLWALIDSTLLVLTIAASSDMLVKLGPVQTLSWLLCYGLTLLRIGMIFPQFLALAAGNKIVFVYPFICLSSVLWSSAPSESLVGGIQLLMTCIIATFLGWRYSLTLIIRAVAVILSVAAALSLLHWATGIFPWPAFTRAGGLAGIFSHKSMLGLRVLIAALAILALWLMPTRTISRVSKRWLLLAMAMVLMSLALSQSATALLLLPAMAYVLFFLCRDRTPPMVVVLLFVGAMVIFAIAPLVLTVLGYDPVTFVLNAVGKDATLTGRTEIWEVAGEVIGEHPILGVGFGAFWKASEFSVLRLATQHAGAITSSSFHNFALEILVSTGPLGLLAVAGLIGAGLYRLAALLSLTGSVAAAIGIVLLLTLVATSFLGPALYRGHDFAMVMVVMLVVSAREDMRTARAALGRGQAG